MTSALLLARSPSRSARQLVPGCGDDVSQSCCARTACGALALTMSQAREPTLGKAQPHPHDGRWTGGSPNAQCRAGPAHEWKNPHEVHRRATTRRTGPHPRYHKRQVVVLAARQPRVQRLYFARSLDGECRRRARAWRPAAAAPPVLESSSAARPALPASRGPRPRPSAVRRRAPR